MKKSVMKKWVAALRSGKYKQGHNVLSKNGKYCCLGVLCEVMGARKQLIYGEELYCDDETGEKLLGILPASIERKAGMKSNYGVIKFKKRNLSLIVLNDGRERSFKHIAAYIERNWEKL